MGRREPITGLILVVAVVLVAGCGSASPTASPRQLRTATTTPTITARSPCTHSGEIRAGVFDAFRMGAVDFSSTADGIGLTAGEFSCFQQTNGGGLNAGYHQAPEQLALTRDSGRSWTLAGRPLPVSAKVTSPYGESVLTVSRRTIWVIAGKGSAFLTTDRGETWTAAPLPRPVLSLQARDGYLWALSCTTRDNTGACHPVIYRRRLSAPGVGDWTKLLAPRLSIAPIPELALLPGGNAVLNVIRPGRRSGTLLVSAGGGSKWRALPEPSWRDGPCSLAHVATSGTDIWLLCQGSAATGSVTQALLLSTDGGSTWHVRSAHAKLAKPPSPSGMTNEGVSALAAVSSDRLLMGLVNGLAYSPDGGRYWFYAKNVNPQGASISFDVISPVQVYALAPGAGLWRTTDGTHWNAVGTLNTG